MTDTNVDAHKDHLEYEQDHLRWSADHMRALAILKRVEAHIFMHEAEIAAHRAEIVRHEETIEHGDAHTPEPPAEEHKKNGPYPRGGRPEPRPSPERNLRPRKVSLRLAGFPSAFVLEPAYSRS
jgi:hypothetical protein